MHHFDFYGWYTSEPLPGRSTEISPGNTSTTHTPGELRANFTGYEWLDLPYKAPPPPALLDPTIVTQQRPVPQAVSMRQARLALLEAGLLERVEQAVSNAGRAAQIEWEYGQEIQRSAALVYEISRALGLDHDQVDGLFRNASMI